MLTSIYRFDTGCAGLIRPEPLNNRE